MAADIGVFTEELLAVTPAFSSVNPHGTNLRFGITGSRETRAGSPANDLTNNLHKAAVEFAEGYKQATITEEQLRRLAQAIEGPLMMEETLSIVSRQKVDYLIDNLHELIEEKYGT